MSRARAVLLFAAFSSACGSVRENSTPDPSLRDGGVVTASTEQKSGTRLRAEYWDLDGLRVPFAFFDTERGEECDFEPFGGADGVHYCLPTVTSTEASLAECPHAEDAFGKPLSRRYIRHTPRDSCAEHEGIFEMTCTLYSNGNCQPHQGPAVDLGGFVGAKEKVEAAAGRIRPLSLVTEDGARLPLGAWDDERNVRVGPSFVADLWLPAGISFPRYFTDSGCTQPATSKFRNSAFCPITVAYDQDPEFPLREVGAPVETPYRRETDGTCVPESNPEDSLWFAVGEPIAAASFEPLRRVAVGKRLQVTYLAGGDGVPVVVEDLSLRSDFARAARYVKFHDVERDEDCQLLVLPDGSAHCVPPGLPAVFSDAACTERAVLVDAGGPAPRAFVEDHWVSCDRWEHTAWSVGAALEGTPYQLDGATCVAAETDGRALYAVGTEVPLEAFVSAPLVRE